MSLFVAALNISENANGTDLFIDGKLSRTHSRGNDGQQTSCRVVIPHVPYIIHMRPHAQTACKKDQFVKDVYQYLIRLGFQNFTTSWTVKLNCFDDSTGQSSNAHDYLRVNLTVQHKKQLTELKACNHPSIAAVYGINDSLMEQFVLQHGIKGPSWIKLNLSFVAQHNRQCQLITLKPYMAYTGDVLKYAGDFLEPIFISIAAIDVQESDAGQLQTISVASTTVVLEDTIPDRTFAVVDTVHELLSNNTTPDEAELLTRVNKRLHDCSPDIVVGINTRNKHVDRYADLCRCHGQRSVLEHHQTRLTKVVVCDIANALDDYFNEANVTTEKLRETQAEKHLGSSDAAVWLRTALDDQILQFSVELARVCGSTWQKALLGMPNVRIESLLLHAFHEAGHLVPCKDREVAREDYEGGKNLEPSKGMHASYSVMLDFDQMYASIIVEANLCATTQHLWAPHAGMLQSAEPQLGLVQFDTVRTATATVPMGVIPSQVQQLMQLRVEKQQLYESTKLHIYNVQQKAIKLTVNSLYGCMAKRGQQFRFAMPQFSAMVSFLGRCLLVYTQQVAMDAGHEVLYGDTDSILLNTHSTDPAEVMVHADKVLATVNSHFSHVHLSFSDLFRRILILEKKQYAALVVQDTVGSYVHHELEIKGLEPRKRNYCELMKRIYEDILSEIMFGTNPLKTGSAVIWHLQHLFEMCQQAIQDPSQWHLFVVTKKLSQLPEEYSLQDQEKEMHVQASFLMRALGQTVRSNQFIEYIVCQTSGVHKSSLRPSFRAFHPETVLQSSKQLVPDIHWYVTQQIVPPIKRLLEAYDTCLAQQADKVIDSIVKQC